MNLPLYDIVNKNLKTTDLTLKEKTYLLESIEKLDQNALDLFYMLIVEHYQRIDLSGEEVPMLPYGGKQTSNGVVYDLSMFPISLKRILYAFVKLTLKKVRKIRKKRGMTSEGEEEDVY